MEPAFFLQKTINAQFTMLGPTVCRLEPFTMVDYDYEKNRIACGVRFSVFKLLLRHLRRKRNIALEEIAKAAQTVVQKILELTAKDMELPITDKRVHSETRSRLLRRQIESSGPAIIINN